MCCKAITKAPQLHNHKVAGKQFHAQSNTRGSRCSLNLSRFRRFRKNYKDFSNSLGKMHENSENFKNHLNSCYRENPY